MLNQIHRNIRLGAVAAVALIFAGTAPPARAEALIAWSLVTNQTGNPSDIVTSGTFLESAFLNATSDTVNGVVFAPEVATGTPGTYDFTGSDISISNLQSLIPGHSTSNLAV